MKKLMFVAAAALAGSVFAAGEITSNNIVGYAGNALDTDAGSVFLSPQFVNVGVGTGLKLKDIKPVPDTEYTIGMYDVIIQFLDNSGATIEDKVFTYDGEKWVYLATEADASDFEIPLGQGVQVDNAVDPNDAIVTFQTAGEVGTADALVELDQDAGSVFAGNPFPLPIKLSTLTLELNQGSEYIIGMYDVIIQFLDNSGATIEDKVFTYDGEKWVYLATEEDASDFEIPAGQGVQVDNAVDPNDAIVTLRIPAPEL